MAYKINKTDGSLLTEIIDSEIDVNATDLTLIGKNVTGYGEYINENFVKLLENFASTSEPNNPIPGQIWFDLTENRLKVYDGNGFIIASGPIVSNSAPLNPKQGDFWIDAKENQLYFYDGVDRQLAGPVYKDSQGISGFEIATISDSFQNQKTITKLWNNASLIGIWSHHAEFTPLSNIPNFTGTIKPGFNAATIPNFKLYARSTSSDALVDFNGNLKTVEDLFVNDGPNTTVGKITILNSNPLSLGVNQENDILVSGSAFQLRSNRNGQDFLFTTRNSNVFTNAITIKSISNRIGVFNDNPSAELDVAGSVIISGNLTVNGATTTINSTNLSIDDKLIELASSSSPSDIFADGGGIVLKGTTDHTITWSNTTDSWNFSEHLNLSSGKVFRIGNSEVLSANALASSVTTALGLTQVGTLTQLQVENITIGLTDENTIATTVGNLVLSPAGIGAVDVTNSRITNVQTPVSNLDAANKLYVDEADPDPWIEISQNYSTNSKKGQFLISTLSNEVVFGLPPNSLAGDFVRFVDFDGSFDVNSLKISRYRKIGSKSGVSAVAGTFEGVGDGLTTITVSGFGTGLKVRVVIAAPGTSYSTTATITPLDQGFGYRSGDQIRVLGSLLGGVDGTNDLLFELDTLDNLFSSDDDVTISVKDAAFGLIYTSIDEGWKYSETLQLPSVINVNVVGNLTGNVTGNVTGNLSGNVTGDLSGNVTGDLVGQVLTSAQPNITSLGTLSNLTVSGTIIGDLTGNVTGQLYGNVTGNNIVSATSLTLQSTLNNINIRSGNNGIRLSAFDDTGTQEQYVIDIDPGTASGNRSTTVLYGNVIVSNISSTNTSGSSFRLPQYSSVNRDALTYSALNYGELIYNTTDNKVQAYTSTGWVDLH